MAMKTNLSFQNSILLRSTKRADEIGENFRVGNLKVSPQLLFLFNVKVSDFRHLKNHEKFIGIETQVGQITEK